MIAPVQLSSREKEIIRLIIQSIITNNTFTEVLPLWERIYNGK